MTTTQAAERTSLLDRPPHLEQHPSSLPKISRRSKIVAGLLLTACVVLLGFLVIPKPSSSSIAIQVNSKSPFLGHVKQNIAFSGPNPTNLLLHVYEPPSIQTNAPLLVALHGCNSTWQLAFDTFGFQSVADKYGFVVLYPEQTNRTTHCWAVNVKECRLHNGGGDAQGVYSMIQAAIEMYKPDPDRVFVTGHSSGAIMTQVMLATYPEVFAAGSAVAGVPFGCCQSPGIRGEWCPECAKQNTTHAGQDWARFVLDAYPSFTGWRPKLQLFHGLSDPLLPPQNLIEEVKQWTSVFGISEQPVVNQVDTPLPGWTKTVYGSGQVEAYTAEGEGHVVFPYAKTDLVEQWFDLACPPGKASCFHRGASIEPSK